MAGFNNAKTGYLGKVYDSKDLNLIVDGELVYAYAPGSTAVEYADDNDNMTAGVDLQGTSYISRNHKATGKLTVNLSQMSPFNKKFTDLLNGTEEFSIDYRDSSIHVSSEHCFITKHPNAQTGETIGTVAWSITVLDRDIESLVGDE